MFFLSASLQKQFRVQILWINEVYGANHVDKEIPVIYNDAELTTIHPQYIILIFCDVRI